MLKSNYKIGISSLLGIMIGFYICIIVKRFSSLSLDPKIIFEINPFELLSVIINILLTLYITRTLSKQNDLEKTEKELLNSYLKDYKNEFCKKIGKLIEEENFQSPEINSTFKILRKKISSILLLANDTKFVNSNDETLVKLEQTVTDIWTLFTDTPNVPATESNIGVREDIKILRLEKVNKIEFQTIEFEKLIFQITMKINKK